MFFFTIVVVKVLYSLNKINLYTYYVIYRSLKSSTFSIIIVKWSRYLIQNVPRSVSLTIYDSDDMPFSMLT